MTIIDVRSPGEFASGHAKNSTNIPLQDISKYVNEIKSMEHPIVLCCASGNRSGQATSYLKAQGIDCENGGSWFEVQQSL